MRNRLIKLLRQFEKESEFKNEYVDFVEQYGCDYWIEECLDFPDYRFVIKRFNDMYSVTTKDGLIFPAPTNSIRGELKRMEADGLVMIGTQEGKKCATTKSKHGPDFDEPAPFVSESIILTTQGKSVWKYSLFKAKENPVTTLLSIAALVISMIALYK